MLKNTHIWLPEYLKKRLTNMTSAIVNNGPKHIMFCVADHFEPAWNKPLYEIEAGRVDRWLSEYPGLASEFTDADGRHPQHTFFYPAEEYRVEHLNKIAYLCSKGFGEVEVHLHHHNDTSNGFRRKIVQCKDRFVKHGLLSRDGRTGDVKFAFIHGNWALDNSRNDDRWCGVNDEINLLGELGCYADFTLPSAPDASQTRKTNSVYYAKDDPLKPKSHDTGVDVEVGKRPSGAIMLVQGPLTLNWRKRKYGIFPRIENSELSHNNPPTHDRVDLWIKERIHVRGSPEWIFVKVYTHGAQEANSDMFFGGAVRDMHRYLGKKYNDGKAYMLHYVTAREMFNIIKAAESGMDGNPSQYRDYILQKVKL